MNGAIVWVLFKAHEKALDARRAGRAPRTYLGYAILSGLIQGLVLATVVGLMIGAWAADLAPLGIFFGIVGGAPVIAPWLVRRVVAPLGTTRIAYRLGRFALVAGDDPEGYGLVCAAWAQLRRPSELGAAWLAARLDERGMTGDAEVIAHALLSASRGDHDGARRLIASVGDLVERHPAARELAGEYLACADAERGDWAAITARAARPEAWPASAMTFFLEGCAQRFTKTLPRPSDRDVVARWLVAPTRVATYPLLKMVLATARPAPAVAPPQPDRVTNETAPPERAHDDATGAPSIMRVATAAHLAALGSATITSAALAAAGRAWDAALADPSLRAWHLARGRELGLDGDAIDQGFRELAEQVSADLADAAQAAGIALAPGASPSGTSAIASSRVRSQRLGELELAFSAWRDRASGETALPAIDEWRAFLALRASYESAVAIAGLELRRLLFPHALAAGSHMSAWLWNKRREYILSHAISQFLLREALAVGDAAAIEHETANSRLKVPTRV